MALIKAKIIAIGSALGEIEVSNEYFNHLDTSDEWIKTRTGISKRHFVKKQGLTDLAAQALNNLFAKTNINTEQIDVLIVATTTADNSFPSCATRLHGIFNMKPTCLAFDINAACNGFVYGMKLASMFLKEQKYVCIVGADIMSKLINPDDRTTAVLFGDGAGAILFAKTDEEIGFLSDDFGTDGSKHNLLYTASEIENVDIKKSPQFIHMKGQEVFKNAVIHMSDSLKNSVSNANLKIEDIDLLIPHQANIRIIDAICNQLNMDHNKVIKTVNIHSNTSAASIPLALDCAQEQFADSKYIAFCGMGAGLTWGSIVMKLKP